jgi:hypothetical protein
MIFALSIEKIFTRKGRLLQHEARPRFAETFGQRELGRWPTPSLHPSLHVPVHVKHNAQVADDRGLVPVGVRNQFDVVARVEQCRGLLHRCSLVGFA